MSENTQHTPTVPASEADAELEAARAAAAESGDSHRPRRSGPRKLLRIVGLIALVAVLVWAFSGVGIHGLGATWREVLSVMWEGFTHPDWAYLYDGSGEDLISLLIQTIAIAFFGTLVAVLGAVLFAFFAASRPGKRRSPVSTTTNVFLAIVRTFPEIVLAVIFVKMVGPGAFAGALAIGFHSVGMLGRLYAEEIEKLSPGPDEAITAVGGSRPMVLLWSQLPRLIPQFMSLALNRFEISVRSATVLGIVGAGGIGTPIIFAVSSRSWDRLSIILIGTIVTVSIIDAISGAIRKRLR